MILASGLSCGVGDVVGQGAEVLEQCPEAVQRQPVIGASWSRPWPWRCSDRTALTTGEARLALASSRYSSSNSMGFRRCAHVPLDVVGQHAQEHMRAHALLAVVEDRAHLQVRPSSSSGRRAPPGPGSCRRPPRRRASSWSAGRLVRITYRPSSAASAAMASCLRAPGQASCR